MSLQQLHSNLWVADLPFSLLGFQLGARCTIVRLPNGDLWIHSPIELNAQLREEVEALGPVKWVVAPNTMHYLHLKEWLDAFPEAKGCAVEKLKPIDGVTIDRVLTFAVEPEWAEVFDQTLFLGSALTTEAMFCHRPSRTLILCDVAFNMPPTRGAFTSAMSRFLGVLNRLSPSKTFKLSIREKKAARQSMETVLSWDFDRVIVSHGEVCEHGKEALRKTYEFLGFPSK